MEIKYPIFILSDDRSVELIEEVEKLNIEFEIYDVEKGEYSGWDVDGYPLKLIWDEKIGAKPELISELPQKDKLRNAILDYLKLYGDEKKFVYREQGNNTIELFREIENSVKEIELAKKKQKTWYKLINFLKNGMKKRAFIFF